MSHAKLALAIKAEHRARPCIQHTGPDLVAAESSMIIRQLLSKFREAKVNDRACDIIKSKASQLRHIPKAMNHPMLSHLVTHQ